MSVTIDIDGPTVPDDVDNEMLRDALLHSPSGRLVNTSSYHVVKVGLREGDFISWIGTWNQSTQKVDAATPTSILDLGRKQTRLRAGQAIVVRVTSTGAPTSLRGAAVTFRLSLVGGRDGKPRALVAPGAQSVDPATRTAVATLQRQINTGGLAQWDETVALLDPAVISGPVVRLPYITPSQITSNQNDYAPTGYLSAAVMRLSSDAARDVTGIAGGSDGREIVLFNIGSQNIVLKNNSGSSVAANRFSIGADYTLGSGGGAPIWYDATTSTWRMY